MGAGMARIDQVLSGEKSWGKWWLDQLGHFGLGTAYALPAVVLSVWLDWGTTIALISGGAGALTGGVIREVLQYHKSQQLHFLDRFLDTLFHIPGAPAALGIVLLIQWGINSA